MKLFKSFSLLGLFFLAILAIGCSQEGVQQEVEVKSREIVTIIASAPSEHESTRVAFDKGNYSLSWKVGDAFQVCGNETGGQKFTCGSINKGRGVFNGGQLAFSGVKHAFYPANKVDVDGYAYTYFDYTGQIQLGNDNVDELSNYMYMTGTVATDNTVTDFVLHSTVLKLTIQMPADFTGAVKEVHVDFGAAKMKSKYNSYYEDAIDSNDGQSLLLYDVDTYDEGVALEGEDLVVYMAMSPLTVTSGTFNLTVTDTSGLKYARVLTGFSYDFLAGKVVPGLFSVEKLYINDLKAEKVEGLSADAGIQTTINVESNTYWLAWVDDAGVSLSQEEGTGNGNVVVTLPANDTGAVKEYTVTVSTDVGDKTIVLKQDAKDNVSVNAVTFPVSFDFTSDKRQDANTTCYAEANNSMASVRTFGARELLSFSTTDKGAIYSNRFTSVGDSGWEFVLPVDNLSAGATIAYVGNMKRSGTGPSEFVLQYSVDGGANFTSGTSVIVVPTSSGAVEAEVVVKEGLPSGNLLLRLTVNKAASSSNGTHRLVNSATFSIK